MGNPVPFRRPSPRSAAHRAPVPRARRPAPVAEDASWWDAARGLGPILLAAPLAVFSAVLLAGGVHEVFAAPEEAPVGVVQPQLVEARFGACIGGQRHTCVVDGDTIWLNHQKIRIADIDAPEIFEPGCDSERAVGMRATERLTQWLNAAPFEVHPNPDGRDTDRYGRKLRVLSRGGSSAVEVLAAEGLATRWGEPRRAWC